LWYQEYDEIIHIEVETGSNKKSNIVRPEKKIDTIDPKTQKKYTDMDTGMHLVCHQPGPVFPYRSQFVTYHLTERGVR
jgi:hypothetical protein